MDLKNALSLALSILVIACSTLAVTLVALRSGQVSEQALTDTVTRQLSSTLALQKHSVEQYFTDSRKLLLDLSARQTVANALSGFSTAIDDLGQEPSHAFTLANSFKALPAFYREEFGQRFTSKTREPLDIDGLIGKLDDTARVLQQAYLVDNPNPVGE